MIPILLEFLKNPSIVEDFGIKDWETLLRQAATSKLSGRVYFLLQKHQLTPLIPEKAIQHLLSSAVIGERYKEQALREIYELTRIIHRKNISLVILKGAAYVAAGIPCHIGRTFTDIDVLVKKADIELVQFGMLVNGWARMEIDDYDEKYYRKWMHEIPPLMHKERMSVVDLHHNILPLTNPDSPKPENFNLNTVFLDKSGPVNVLADEDMLIHSATHLFSESEFDSGLRDLSDIDLMLSDFEEKNKDFVDKLIERSETLDLTKYVFLALRYLNLILDNKTASSAGSSLLKRANYSSITLKFLDFCFINRLTPDHATSRTWKFHIASFMLYLRGHFIRMPLRLLIPHLLHKSFITPFVKWKKERQLQHTAGQ